MFRKLYDKIFKQRELKKAQNLSQYVSCMKRLKNDDKLSAPVVNDTERVLHMLYLNNIEYEMSISSLGRCTIAINLDHHCVGIMKDVARLTIEGIIHSFHFSPDLTDDNSMYLVIN